MTLSSFPPELLFLICELAWNNLGDSNLPLVSKQFHAITQPLRYRAIAITKPLPSPFLIPKNLPTFHRIRHLFVSHAPQNAPAWMDTLREISDSLVTLSVELTSSHLLACVFRVRFPLLRELTINGFYPFPAGKVNMPRLIRLHFSGNRNPCGLLGATWSGMAGLQVLRISGVSGASMFANEIQEALDCDDDVVLPQTLKLVIVQPGPEVPSKKRADEEMLSTFRELEKREQVKGAQLRLVEERSSSTKSETQLALQMWRDGIDGCDSWWM